MDHYVRLLDFPADVLTALTACDINLFEASQLARVTATRLGLTSSQARTRRFALYAPETKESGPRLRQCVNEILRASVAEARGSEAIEADFFRFLI